jgi:hypothetical protein
VGAVAILSRAYREEGITGWYKVDLCFLLTANIVLTPLFLGYGCTNHQGSTFSSAVVHVQGPIRSIRPDPHDCMGAIDQRDSFVAIACTNVPGLN